MQQNNTSEFEIERKKRFDEARAKLKARIEEKAKIEEDAKLETKALINQQLKTHQNQEAKNNNIVVVMLVILIVVICIMFYILEVYGFVALLLGSTAFISVGGLIAAIFAPPMTKEEETQVEFGSLNIHMICPHCNTTGNIYTKSITKKRELVEVKP